MKVEFLSTLYERNALNSKAHKKSEENVELLKALCCIMSNREKTLEMIELFTSPDMTKSEVLELLFDLNDRLDKFEFARSSLYKVDTSILTEIDWCRSIDDVQVLLDAKEAINRLSDAYFDMLEESDKAMDVFDIMGAPASEVIRFVQELAKLGPYDVTT